MLRSEPGAASAIGAVERWEVPGGVLMRCFVEGEVGRARERGKGEGRWDYLRVAFLGHEGGGVCEGGGVVLLHARRCRHRGARMVWRFAECDGELQTMHSRSNLERIR